MEPKLTPVHELRLFMSLWHRFSMILTGLMLAVLACSSGFPAAPPEGPGEVLFADDFSSPDSGWLKAKDQDGSADYVDGKYHLVIDAPGTIGWATPAKFFEDVSIDVQAEMVRGTSDNQFGMICRYVDAENFYFFVISSDGYYGIGKVKDGAQILLNHPEMLPSELIHQDEATNSLRAVCAGSTLTFYVNDLALDTAVDGEFQTGDVGLLAGTFAEGGVEIAFDHFNVKMP